MPIFAASQLVRVAGGQLGLLVDLLRMLQPQPQAVILTAGERVEKTSKREAVSKLFQARVVRVHAQRRPGHSRFRASRPPDQSPVGGRRCPSSSGKSIWGFRLVPVIAAVVVVAAGVATVSGGEKEALYASIDKRRAASWEAALKIWRWAEPGYLETKSAAYLADLLEREGFRVERGVAGIPTAFTASFGTGKPVIGILGEFDALPGLSQAAVPYRQPRDDTGYGHGCGHHLFGVASAAASIALAEQFEAGKVAGTIRFYGCPAEEGGGAKVFMVRAGLFNDCDAVLHWHPSNRNSAGDRSSLARMAVKFRFYGNAAHAAGAPEQGRSALDAVDVTTFAAQLLREHTPDFTRIHHVVTNGGSAPNVVPDFSEVYFYVRHPQGDVLRPLYDRLILCARAGALATETELEIDFQGGIREILPNNTLAQVTMSNLKALNALEYSQEETEFALRLQATLPKPESLDSIHSVEDRSGTVGKGSTDVGDVSWAVPTTGFSTACWVPGTPGHSWQATACGGTEIARKGMELAARVLAASAWDLLHQPGTLAEARQEHQRRLDTQPYESLMETNQKPPLDYRKPAKRRRRVNKDAPQLWQDSAEQDAANP